MVTVRITQHTVAHGRPVYVGDVIEVDDRDARTLVSMDKAVIVVAAAAGEVETATDKAAEGAVDEAQYRTRTRRTRE